MAVQIPFERNNLGLPYWTMILAICVFGWRIQMSGHSNFGIFNNVECIHLLRVIAEWVVDVILLQIGLKCFSMSMTFHLFDELLNSEIFCFFHKCMWQSWNSEVNVCFLHLVDCGSPTGLTVFDNATPESNSFVQLSLKEIVGGDRGWHIYFLVYDLLQIPSQQHSRYIKLGVYRKGWLHYILFLKNFNPLRWASCISTPIHRILVSFHFFCLYHARRGLVKSSLYGPLSSLSMGFTAIENTVCLSCLKFVFPLSILNLWCSVNWLHVVNVLEGNCPELTHCPGVCKINGIASWMSLKSSEIKNFLSWRVSTTLKSFLVASASLHLALPHFIRPILRVLKIVPKRIFLISRIQSHHLLLVRRRVFRLFATGSACIGLSSWFNISPYSFTNRCNSCRWANRGRSLCFCFSLWSVRKASTSVINANASSSSQRSPARCCRALCRSSLWPTCSIHEKSLTHEWELSLLQIQFEFPLHIYLASNWLWLPVRANFGVPRIQAFRSVDFLSRGKVYTAHINGSVNCKNTSVSFVMKNCPTSTVFKNPASVQIFITRSCCESLFTRSFYFCNKSSCARSFSRRCRCCYQQSCWLDNGSDFQPHPPGTEVQW